jgi:hypothetical protein
LLLAAVHLSVWHIFGSMFVSNSFVLSLNSHVSFANGPQFKLTVLGLTFAGGVLYRHEMYSVTNGITLVWSVFDIKV